jgi:hypothetical protein
VVAKNANGAMMTPLVGSGGIFLVGVWIQAVCFLLVRLVGIWLRSPRIYFHV